MIMEAKSTAPDTHTLMFVNREEKGKTGNTIPIPIITTTIETNRRPLFQHHYSPSTTTSTLPKHRTHKNIDKSRIISGTTPVDNITTEFLTEIILQTDRRSQTIIRTMRVSRPLMSASRYNTSPEKVNRTIVPGIRVTSITVLPG